MRREQLLGNVKCILIIKCEILPGEPYYIVLNGFTNVRSCVYIYIYHLCFPMCELACSPKQFES